MGSVKKIHGQLSDVNQNGDVYILYPETTANDVYVDSPSDDVSTVQDFVNEIGDLAYKSTIEASDFAADVIVNNTSTDVSGKILDARVAKELSDRLQVLEEANTLIYDEIYDDELAPPESEINDKDISIASTWSSSKILEEVNERTEVLKSGDSTNRQYIEYVDEQVSSLSKEIAGYKTLSSSSSGNTDVDSMKRILNNLKSGYGDDTSYQDADQAIKAELNKLKNSGQTTFTVKQSGDLNVLVNSTVSLTKGNLGVDTSLTMRGYAAESRETGNKINKLTNRIINIEAAIKSGEFDNIGNSDSLSPTYTSEPASKTTPGIVKIGTNIDVDENGLISVKSATTELRGVVKLEDSTSDSTTTAITPNGVKTALKNILTNTFSSSPSQTLAATPYLVESAITNRYGTYPKDDYTIDTSGSTFGKNFMWINLNNKDDVVNQTTIFNKSSDNGWMNYPTWLSGSCMGIRKVYYYSSSCVMVSITEISPIQGRTSYAVWNGSTWTGWKQYNYSVGNNITNNNGVLSVQDASGSTKGVVTLTDNIYKSGTNNVITTSSCAVSPTGVNNAFNSWNIPKNKLITSLGGTPVLTSNISYGVWIPTANGIGTYYSHAGAYFKFDRVVIVSFYIEGLSNSTGRGNAFYIDMSSLLNTLRVQLGDFNIDVVRWFAGGGYAAGLYNGGTSTPRIFNGWTIDKSSSKIFARASYVNPSNNDNINYSTSTYMECCGESGKAIYASGTIMFHTT